MPWQRINSRYVRQDYPGLRAQWFWDVTTRGSGELIMWLDERGRVAAFQLSHEEWPSLRHYLAEWQMGRDVRIGTVDDGDRSGRVIGRKPAPIIRFGRGADPQSAGRLLRYFRSNAGALEPAARQTIQAVLGEATDSPTGRAA